MSGLPPKAAEERDIPDRQLGATTGRNKSGKVRTNKSLNVHQAALSIFRTRRAPITTSFQPICQ